MIQVEARIALVAPGDVAAFEAVHAIYSRTIDASERKAEAEMRAAFANPAYRFLAARTDAGIVGFSIVYLSPGADIWVLEYLAVEARSEGQGLGGRLFAASVAEGGGRIGLVEVDSDVADAAMDAATAKRRRRLAFYGRAGCRRLGDIGYLLPLRAYGTPPPMDLLIHAPAAVGEIGAATARGWLTRLYVEVYCQSANDQRIGVMLDNAPSAIPLKPVGSIRV